MAKRNFLYFSFDIDALLLDIANCLIMELSIDEIKFDFSLVVEISESTHHGSDFLNLLVVVTMMSGSLINRLIETELPEGILFDILS